MGVTGAGLTNAFWMRPGTVLMQLLPYGWLLPEGELIRTGLSRDMSLSLNGTYLQVRHLQPCSARKTCQSTPGLERQPAQTCSLRAAVLLAGGAASLRAAPFLLLLQHTHPNERASPCKPHTP